MMEITCGNLAFWMKNGATKAEIGRRLVKLDTKLNKEETGLSGLTRIKRNKDFTEPTKYIHTLVLLKAGGAIVEFPKKKQDGGM